MVKHIPLLMAVAALGVTSLAPAADARPRRDHREQDAAYKARQQGRIMSLRTIESRIMPRMRGAEYLGPELDAGSGTYRLKFMRGGRVIWIDVDARTGRVLGRSGH
ncbi:PepSY domain-containing protein [Enterovirga sp. GCM10030262]|uniref:PepSY domain-containing protein n=1 Tax=Enterovirga sp. GCM10030262 TaxID=3273391 RepID=UPI0036075053